MVLVCVTLATMVGVVRGEPRAAKPVKGDDPEAIDHVVLRKASTHPIRYFFSLPKNYARQQGRRWPVLVVLPGKGDQFEEVADAFARARGDLPLILVVPCSLANNWRIDDHLLNKYREFYEITETIQTESGEHYKGKNLPEPMQRLRWDEEGIFAIVDDLQKECDGQERFYLNGFSAGGFVTYQFVFTHPHALAGAILVCANFADQKYRVNAASDKQVARQLPVYLFEGEDDPLGSHPSWTRRQRLNYFIACVVALVVLGSVVFYRTRRRWPAIAFVVAGSIAAGVIIETFVVDSGIHMDNEKAERVLHELGYEQTKRTIVPGMGHEPAEQIVMTTVASLLNSSTDQR
jgi:predicted esterase